MAKFNFKKAFDASLPAFAGGAVSTEVTRLVRDNVPQAEEYAEFVPVALGFVLSQNKNKMMSGAGLGMIGAAAGPVLAKAGVFNGLGAPKKQMRLSPAQKRRAAEAVKKQMKVAGPSPDLESKLAGAMDYVNANY
jgi:hypothetical protein